jgi:hypothetical protein
MTLKIMYRKRVLVNTDPQRRCYDGCHFSSELRWTEWESLESNVPEGRIDARLSFCRGLNDYAVSQRGEGAKAEFKAAPEDN